MTTSRSPSSHLRWPVLAAAVLNGFVGDWLEKQANPLAMHLQIRHQGQALDPSGPQVDAPRRTLILLVHGLTELETIWDFPSEPGRHYASELAGPLSATPLCLRYNTGRAIHRNGDDLADTLEQLVSHWPVPVENLILIGHSMGGLLIRAACHSGSERQHGWPALVDACVYLGTPHDGSWLARLARGGAGLLRQMPRDYLRVIGESIDQRSEGIHDLSRGDIVADAADAPPLLPGARHFAIAGLLAKQRRHPVNALFGDALVQENSARGAGRPGWALTDYACFTGVDHIRLTHHEDVCRKLKEWLV